MIEQYKSVTKLDILLCPFQDGISIEKKIQLGMFFDVIFLDMEMEGITGIEVGKWLREIRKNEKTEIIYMAEDERHVVELFQNRPFDFLLKPLTEKNTTRPILTLPDSSSQTRTCLKAIAFSIVSWKPAYLSTAPRTRQATTPPV